VGIARHPRTLLAARMELGVHVEQPAHFHARVDLGGGDGGVA
jgi:hypothetical protein